MNVTGISKTNLYLQNDVQGGVKQLAQDFQSLESAFQAGDLTSAQNAFASIQQDMKNGPGAKLAGVFGQDSQLSKDFQALQSALQSGDLAGAKQALATMQKDMQAAHTSHAHHHHHHRKVQSENDGDSDGSTTPSDDSASSSSSTVGVNLDQMI